MKKGLYRFLSAGICAMLVLSLTGCQSGKKDEKTQTSLGVDNEIAGFLLNFDPRQETAQMIKDKDKDIFPVGVNWNFAEEIKKGKKIPEYSSTDPDFAKDIFYALCNTIVMGNADNHSEETPLYIEMVLQDGQTVRYDFVALNTVRLAGQNYVIESDGNLWSLIRKESKDSAGRAG